nr:MAG TPA: hypothetical protein [Bacteriophage sp.]
MSNFMNADPNVRISDTADASKTAADGWVVSPAAVAETQTYHKVENLSAVSNVSIDTSAIYTTGKNVDVYIGIKTTATFNGEVLITGVPRPVSTYTLATFTDNNGVLKGFGWVNNGGIRAPSGLSAGTWFIVAHYTTY